MKINCSIIVEQHIDITQFIQKLPKEFIPIQIQKKHIEDLQKDIEAFRDWVTEYNKRMGVN